MRSIHRTILGIALTIGLLTVSGCQTLGFRDRLAIKKKNLQPVVRHEPKMDAAQLAETRGKLEEARRIYTDILQGSPRNAECAHRLGAIYAKLGRPAEAEVYYRRAYEIKGDSPQLLADMGYAAFLRKDYQESEKWLEKSIKLDSSNRKAMTNLAIVRAWQNKDDSSLATFRMIEDEGEALRNLGAIQIARGDKSLGVKSYELAQSKALQPVAVAAAPEALPPSPQVFAANPDELSKLAPALTIAAGNHDRRMGFQSSRVVQMSRIVNDDENDVVPAPSPPVCDPNIELISTCIRTTTSIAGLPAAVTAIGMAIQPCSVTDEFDENEVDLNSDIQTINAEVVAEPADDLVFELPIMGSTPVENSQDQSILMNTPQVSRERVPQILPSWDDDWDVEPTVSVDVSNSPIHDFQSFCLVTLLEERQLVEGSPKLKHEYHGQSYHFASNEALAKFRKDPDRFVPAAGGLDLVSFRQNGEVIQGSLNFATWHRHRLYLFNNRENNLRFQGSPDRYVALD